MATKNGKNNEQLEKEIQSLLMENLHISVNALAAKTGVHYTVVERILESLKSKGLLPEPQMASPEVNLPKPLTFVNYEFNPKGSCIRIIPINDIHIGAPEGQVDWEKLLGTVDYICNTEDTYAVGLGDYIDGMPHGFTTDRGHPSPWESEHNPTEQAWLFFDKILYPIASKGKMLGFLMGDHDGWLWQDRGTNIDQLLAKFLEINTNYRVPYLANGFWMSLKVGQYLYNMYGIHGSGNAKTDSGRRGVVSRQFERINADVKLTGHHHLIDTWKTPYMDNGIVRKSYIVMCGTMHKYEQSYAQDWGLHPNVTGAAKIKFYKNERDMHVSI